MTGGSATLHTVAGSSPLGRRVIVFQIDSGAGMQEVVSILGPDIVLEHGLCAEAILGVLRSDLGGEGGITPERFEENPVFVRYLRALLAEHVYNVEGLRRAAQDQEDGYVYLIDARTPLPKGRVPAVDIIGAVQVHAASLAPGTYQHNPNHRVLTEYGFFRLPPELEAVLQTDLCRRCAQPR